MEGKWREEVKEGKEKGLTFNEDEVAFFERVKNEGCFCRERERCN